MELNGIANMLCLINDAEMNSRMSSHDIHVLKDQLDILERYMCAYRKAQDDGTYAPTWSTVRENRNLYPNNRGEVKHDVYRKP